MKDPFLEIKSPIQDNHRTMPKTPSNKLFRLIKSLTGSEKRYFKIFIKANGDKVNKYVQLFDAIDQQEVFDDEALRKLIYQNRPIQSRKYSELKAYLYELILKSLQSFDEKTSVEFRLKGMLQSVKVLYKRSLFEDCKDLLAKGRKLAHKYERFNVVLEILEWEKQIAYAETNIGFLDTELDRIDEEEKAVLQQLRNISEYRNLFFRLLVGLRKDASLRKKEGREKLLKLIDYPLLKDIDSAQSHQARVLYYRIYSLYYFAQADFTNFYQTGIRLIALMEEKPHFLGEDVSEYISTLSNFILACGQMGKYEELEMQLQKMDKIKPKTLDDELKIHRQYYQLKFSLCIAKGAFAEGLQALNNHFKERRKFDPNYFENNTFYYNYFYIYFGVGDYDKALEFLNKWLNLAKSVERQDLQSIARILNLIIHYELGNTVLLESLLRSTYRFLKKRDRLQNVERKIIHFIKEAMEAQSKKDLKNVLENLKTSFEELSQDSFAQSLLTRPFNVMAWLESKIENKPFEQIVQEKFRERISGVT